MSSNIKQTCGLDVEKRLVRQWLKDPRSSVRYGGGSLLNRLVNKWSQHQFYVHWGELFYEPFPLLFCFKGILKNYNWNIVVDFEES